MLCAVGDLIEDVVAHLRGPIRPGADASAHITRHRGGSAANVAAAAARLTGRSRFVGAVGDDPIGASMVNDLEALGVDCRVQRIGTTGTIVDLVDAEGERTFITDRGASPMLTLSAPGLLDEVSVLHIAGYGLAGGPITATVVELASTAHERGVPVAVDPSSISVGIDLGVDRYREAIAALAPDVMLPNQAEAEQLDLVDRPLAALTVVTAGSAPTTIVNGERGARSAVGEALHQQVDVPTRAGAVVDSTGAGDAFAAGFLTAWTTGRSVGDAVADGHAVAAHVIGGAGGDHWT